MVLVQGGKVREQGGVWVEVGVVVEVECPGVEEWDWEVTVSVLVVEPL